jgi:enamine deaminase RidA (YjgF/YER057c/UK114 family)
MLMSDRLNISSGTSWESIAGFSRAVRLGNAIHISGTTATDEDGNVVGLGDPYAQTIYIIQKIERALQQVGASLQDVVRTRIYIVHLEQWEVVARAHGEYFSQIRPANTLVQVSGLVGDGYLVEMEADALLKTT